eukprot:tig00021742_g23335.t1
MRRPQPAAFAAPVAPVGLSGARHAHAVSSWRAATVGRDSVTTSLRRTLIGRRLCAAPLPAAAAPRDSRRFTWTGPRAAAGGFEGLVHFAAYHRSGLPRPRPPRAAPLRADSPAASRDLSAWVADQVVYVQTHTREIADQIFNKDQFFALSLFPYLAFLYEAKKLADAGHFPKQAYKGFVFLLVFVFGTIPAGLYARSAYGRELMDVDWLHGSAESLLTITNILIVLGVRSSVAELMEGGEDARRGEGPREEAERPDGGDGER